MVFDWWAEVERQKMAQGDVIIDLVAGFQHQADAVHFLRDLEERLAKFGLEVHPEKTRLIAFGRFAASVYRKLGEGKPETFAFLGFTLYYPCFRDSECRDWRHVLRQALPALGRLYLPSRFSVRTPETRSGRAISFSPSVCPASHRPGRR